MENSNNMEEAATSSENAEEVKRGINEVLKEMEEEKKTKAAADQASLDTLMADFPGEEKCNALLGGMPLKDFSMLATRLLKHHYKVEDKNIIFTTAYAMSAYDTLPASAFLTVGVADSNRVSMSMAKLLPFKQFFTGAMEEEDEENEAGQIIALLQFSQVVEAHARNLDMVATVALQAFLFVAAMNLTDKKLKGSSVMLDPLRVNSLSKADTKKKLQLISTINKVLYKKSRTFGDKKLSAQLHRDLKKMIPDY